MKRNVNVFIAVVLCAALCGGIVWLQTASDEKLGWNIHDTYGEAPAYSNGAAYTNATFAGPSASEGGVMSLSPSRLLRARSSYSYASAYTSSFPSLQGGAGVGSFASSPLTSSAPAGGGLYATSSQTFNSYGGGGNGGAAMGGGAMSNGRSNSGLSTPSLGGAGVGISPIAYSTARRGDMSSASGDDMAMMAAENPMMSVASAANAGMGNSFYGYSVMDYSSAADYGQYTGMFGGGSRSNVRGRQNANGSHDNSWRMWLLYTWLPGMTNGWGTQGADGNWYITEDDLLAAYNAFISGWNSTMGGGEGDAPTWEEWLAWFDPYGSGSGLSLGDNTYYWVPVGDLSPLFLLAFLYIVFVMLKSQKLNGTLKSLFMNNKNNK